MRLVAALAATTPTTTTTAVVATATPAATTTAAEVAARAATGAVFARTRFIDREGTTLDGFSVEEADRFLRFLGRGHGDEGKAAGFAREFVLHERGFLNGAGFGEEILKFDLGCVKGEIPDV